MKKLDKMLAIIAMIIASQSLAFATKSEALAISDSIIINSTKLNKIYCFGDKLELPITIVGNAISSANILVYLLTADGGNKMKIEASSTVIGSNLEIMLDNPLLKKRILKIEISIKNKPEINIKADRFFYFDYSGDMFFHPPTYFTEICLHPSKSFTLDTAGVEILSSIAWYKNNMLLSVNSINFSYSNVKRFDNIFVTATGISRCTKDTIKYRSQEFDVYLEDVEKENVIVSITGFRNFCTGLVEVENHFLNYEKGRIWLYDYKMTVAGLNTSISGGTMYYLNINFLPDIKERSIIINSEFEFGNRVCVLNTISYSNTIEIKTIPNEEDCPFAILTSIGNTLKVVKRDGSPYLGNYKLYKDTTFIADFTGQIAASVSGSYFVEYLDCICEATLLRSDAYSFIYNPLITNSIDQHNQNEIEIYPNPSQGFFYIKNAEIVKVYDLLGNFVTQSENETLVLASKGIYLAEIITKFGKTYQKLIVK